jgi:hypothetical protein
VALASLATSTISRRYNMGGGGSGGWNTLGDLGALEQKAKDALQAGKKNVFISFSTEDMREVNLLRAQAKNENSDIEFNDHSVREPYDSDRAAYIKERISERIARTSTTVVYLSEHTAASRWVAWEVQKSQELGKPVIAVHAGERPPTNKPAWMNTSSIKILPWSKLADELR